MGRAKTLLIVVLLLLLASTSQAVIIDFESLYPGYESWGVVPSPYAGFNWSSTDWITKNYLAPPNGYYNTIQGHVGISGPYEATMTMNGRPFAVVGARVGAAWNDGQYVWFAGYRNSSLVSYAYRLTSYFGGDMTFGMGYYDTLRIIPDANTGTDHASGDNGVGHHIVVDNLDLYVPDPPDAKAGPDQTVEQATSAGTEVTFDGSSSTAGTAGQVMPWQNVVNVNSGWTYDDIQWQHANLPAGVTPLKATLSIQAWDVDPDEDDAVYFWDAHSPGQWHYLGILTKGSSSGETTLSVFNLNPAWLLSNYVYVVVDANWAVDIQVSTLSVVCVGQPSITYQWKEGTTVLGYGKTLKVTLPLGLHNILLTVTDLAGQTDTDTVQILVQDTTPPVLTVPKDITVEQATRNGTKVTFSCSATDICDTSVDVACTPASGTVFPLGTTTVNCTATDDSGNVARDTFKVKVVDTTPPELTWKLLKDTLWPVNHKMVLCATLSVYDICDAAPVVDINVTSNEPINGLGDGNTVPDWTVVKSGGVWEVWLRAERAGPSPGREYSLSVVVTDASGNQSTASGTVKVPHDQGKGK
ncbi:MAG: HYR domain-containing protein [Armatimonadia bacterium]